MDQIPFVKYHGAGNDFIMIDDMQGLWGPRLKKEWVARVCHRRFGVGADGLILLQQGSDGADFFMKYYNADGHTSTFCGNGGRCAVAFAATIGLHTGSCKFLGTDGIHLGEILSDRRVRISMADVHEIVSLDDKSVTLYTGSPHYVTFADRVADLDVYTEGKAIRNSTRFKAEGINVNFVETTGPHEIIIRTYERGVEDETFACGTGVVAAAIASSYQSKGEHTSWLVHAQGGDLQVDFEKRSHQDYLAVRLTGPAVAVFKGEISA